MKYKYECYGYGHNGVVIWEVDEVNNLERCLTGDKHSDWVPKAGPCTWL